VRKVDSSEILRFAITLYIPGFFVSLGFNIVSPIISDYARSFGVSLGMAALIVTANAVGRLVADIPVGTLCDRIGRRPLALAGPLLVTVSAILCGLAQNFYELLVYRAIGGAAMSMWMIARQSMIADSIDPSIRGRILSTFMSVNMIGSATGPAIGGFIYDLWQDYRAPFFFYGASTFVSFIACLVLVKETATPKRGDADAPTRPQPNHAMREILKYLNFTILIAAFANFSNHIRFAARGFLIPLFGYDMLFLSKSEVGIILSFSSLINIILAVPGGMIVDRFGRKVGIVTSLFASAAAYAVIPLSQDFVSFLLMVALLGVAGGIGGGATMALATDLAPSHLRGAFLGLWTTVGDIGSAVGPIIAGSIADLSGLAAAFYGTAVLLALGATTTQIFVKETLRKEAG
jgi:DHA1 family multidrug resistance protein-like MFS transporter